MLEGDGGATDMESLSIEVGRRVRMRREALGLKQHELAEQAGLSPSYVSRLEAGQAGVPDELTKVVRALGVTLGDIVGETDEAMLAEVRQRLPDGTELAISFERIVRGRPGQSDDDQEFIRRSIEALADRYGRKDDPADET